MNELDKVAEAYSQKDLQALETDLGINFHKKHLLITALSHRSPRGEPLFSKKENKKLGLIGDSLIDLIIFENNYKKDKSLEEMDDERQEIAVNPQLNVIARQLGLDQYLFLEDSVNEFILNQSKSLGADTIEALTGAIYLDQGFEKAKAFILTHILASLKENVSEENYKEINEVLEADSVVIELGDRGGAVENLTRASWYVVGGLDAFLDSVARRAKYGFFQGKVIAKNHVGWLPKDIVYEGRSIGGDTSYRISEVKPDGDVQVTPNTIMTCKIIIL